MIRFESLTSATRLLYGLVLVSASITADETAIDQRFQYQGTITQGLFYTNNNNFSGPSDDDLSFEFTELSLNASYNFSPANRVAGQLLYRKSGETSDGLDIDYLFLDSQMFTDANGAAGVRLGRAKIPFGLYNDARDIAYTRPSIVLSQSIYPDTLRDLFISADGVLLYTHLFTDRGQWNVELGTGIPRISDFNDLELEETKNERVRFGRIGFEDASGTWKFSISALGGGVDFNFDPSSFVPFPGISPVPIRADLYMYLLSLQANLGNWTLSGEYVHKDQDLDIPTIFAPPALGSFPINIDRDEVGEAYFIQVENRFTTDLSALVRWDVDVRDSSDRSGKEFAATFNEPAHSRYARDITFGVRWQISSQWLFNMEYHRVEGTSWLSFRDNPNGRNHKNWDLVAATLSFRY